MNDDRLIRDLRALDRPIAIDAVFGDRLFARLRLERRRRSRRAPIILLAATLVIGASLAVVISGGGGPRPDDPPIEAVPTRQTWPLPSNGTPIHLEYAIPSDVVVAVTDGGTYLAFTPEPGAAFVLDGQTATLPADARGVKVTDVARATAHYSNDRPLGVDAASFLDGLRSHPVLRADMTATSPARLGAVDAWTADLRSADPQAHLDKDGVMIDLWPPSRLIVADVGHRIVLVQIWAATPEGLAAWLPTGERLVDSFRLESGG